MLCVAPVLWAQACSRDTCMSHKLSAAQVGSWYSAVDEKSTINKSSLLVSGV